MRCSLRIRWRVRVLTFSRCAASRVVSNLSADFSFLSPETARTCAAISAICSVNAVKAELSIVITFIFSPFFWFLRQNSAINKRGFNSSLRVSRKIFIGNGSVTRTGGATYSLSAGNDMCSRGQRYLCGKPEMF